MEKKEKWSRMRGSGGQGWSPSFKCVVRVGHNIPREANNVLGKGKAAEAGGLALSRRREGGLQSPGRGWF